MITVDQSALEQSIQRWQQSIGLKIAQLGLAAEKVVLIEGGRLAEELMDFTPRADKKQIEIDVKRSFLSLNVDHQRRAHGKSGKLTAEYTTSYDTEWYAFQDNAIFGVGRDRDMRDASADDLYKVYTTTTVQKGGRLKVGQRGKQSIYVWQKILTKASTVNQVVQRIKRHVGRMAAGWVVGFRGLEAEGYKSSKTLPKYITDNEQGARGTFSHTLKVLGAPSITIENHAVGIGNKSMESILAHALDTRAYKMTERMKHLLDHPEKISEET